MNIWSIATTYTLVHVLMETVFWGFFVGAERKSLYISSIQITKEIAVFYYQPLCNTFGSNILGGLLKYLKALFLKNVHNL